MNPEPADASFFHIQRHIRSRSRQRVEGAPFIRDHIIRVTPHAFDDFAGSGADAATNRRLLGL